MRQEIDRGIAVALGIDDDFQMYRSLLGADPLISGDEPVAAAENLTPPIGD